MVVDSVLPAIGRIYTRFVFGRQWWNVRPFEGDVRTLEHAVVERCLVVKSGGVFTTRPSVKVFDPYARVRLKFAEHAAPSFPMTPAAFAASRPGRKKRMYQDIQADFLETVYDFDREACTSSFVKCEKTQQRTEPNLDQPGLAKDPVPRCINTRNAPFHMLYGRYTVPVEKQVYDEWSKVFGFPLITKCLTSTQKAALLRDHWDHVAQFGKPVAISLDYSRMDQHEQEPALRFGHWTVAVHYPPHCQGELNKVIKKQLNNHTKARCKDGKLSANLGAMRMSGDMDTSLGNCSIAAANLYLFLKDSGISKRIARAVLDGDDAVIIVPSHMLSKLYGITGYFHQLGFSLTLEPPVYIFEQIEFCQTRPVWLGSKWMMVRDPEKVLNCDLSGYNNLLNLKYTRQLFHAIGTGGLALARGVPVLQAFYLMAQRIGLKGKTLKDFSDVAHFGWARLAYMEGYHSSPLPIDDEARLSFWRAFGIPPSTQTILEAEFAEVTLSEEVHWALANDTYLLTQTSIPLLPF